MTVARDVRARPPAGTLTTAERVRLMAVMKLRMMRNGRGRSVARTIGFVLGALWAIGAAGVASLGLIGLRWQDAGLAADATTAAFAALTVGWTLLPLLIFGIGALDRLGNGLTASDVQQSERPVRASAS